MNKLNVVFDCKTDLCSLKSNIEKFLILLSDNKYKYISIEYHCQNFDSKTVCRFLKWEKEYLRTFMKHSDVVFSSVIYISANSLSPKLLKLFAPPYTKLIIEISDRNDYDYISKYSKQFVKRKVPFSVLNEAAYNFSTQELINYYTDLSKMKMNLQIDKCPERFYTLNDFFSDWCYDVNGIDISIFSNVVTMCLMNINSGDCHHNSCLGNTICISDDGKISFCPYNTEATQIGNIYNIDQLNYIFRDELFLNSLNKCVLKRRNCKSNCREYTLCEGGCPLKISSIDECNERPYIEFITNACMIIRDIFSNKNYDSINPVLRERFLMAIAAGKGLM